MRFRGARTKRAYLAGMPPTGSFDVPYAITRRLEHIDLAAARARVTAALAAEGFGVLTEIDVATTLEKKIGVHIAPYVILGACNPTLAHRAIAAQPAIGLLLPCNVVLAQEGDDVIVSAASPRAMFSIVVDGGELAPIAEDAEQRLRRAIAAT
jgi:uncharacterized protein (DUF302 family)